MTTTKPYLPLTYVPGDPMTDAFWKAAQEKTLAFQRCADCQAFRHPPGPLCPQCNSFSWEFAPVAGKGTVFTFNVVYHPLMSSLADYIPFNVTVVEFPDAPGVRFITNVVGTPPDEIHVGMPVEVVFEETADGKIIPRVQPAKA